MRTFFDRAGIALVVGCLFGALAAMLDSGVVSWSVVLFFFLLWGLLGTNQR